MGFKNHRKVLKLVFEDPEMDGLEVRARSLPLGTFMDEFADMPNLAGRDPKSLTREERARSWSVIESFAGVLVDWNLEEEDDTPVPATLEGLKSLDLDFALKLLHAYMDAVGGVDAPLGDGSTSGETTLAASLPMEALSASRAS